MVRKGDQNGKDRSNPWIVVAHAAFVLAAATLVYGFVTASREGETRRRCAPTCLLKPAYAGADRTAPGFDLTDMDGQHVTIASYKGKVVVLNFWTKTCAACLEEMPSLVTLTKILASRADVAVLAISTDEGPAAVRDTLGIVLKSERPPFKILFDPDAKAVGGKFGTRLFPETWLLDKHGTIRARFDGARDWTNPAVVELVDQLRNDSYCPVEIKAGRTAGEAAGVCQELASGAP